MQWLRESEGARRSTYLMRAVVVFGVMLGSWKGEAGAGGD
jgi:hypothetical protein